MARSLRLLISDSIAISPGQTGQIECYENRTYRVAPTQNEHLPWSSRAERVFYAARRRLKLELAALCIHFSGPMEMHQANISTTVSETKSSWLGAVK